VFPASSWSPRFGSFSLGTSHLRRIAGCQSNEIVKGSGSYLAEGTYDDSGLIDVWWLDRLHASKYGS